MNTYREHTKYITVDENGKPTNEKFKTITILPTTTNGDVIKVMFPNLEIVGHLYIPKKKIVAKLYPEDCTHDFDLDWWNAPFKAEREDKECSE